MKNSLFVLSLTISFATSALAAWNITCRNQPENAELIFSETSISGAPVLSFQSGFVSIIGLSEILIDLSDQGDIQEVSAVQRPEKDPLSYTSIRFSIPVWRLPGGFPATVRAELGWGRRTIEQKTFTMQCTAQNVVY